MVTQARTLQVLMNGILVGQLKKENNGSLSFFYEKKWLEQSGARPISLSLPLSWRPYRGDVVFNFFDNLLPDNPQIRARIQAKFQITTSQPFDLLESIGRDCIGAIQLCDEKISFSQEIKAEALSNSEIAALLKNYRNAPLGMPDVNTDFRISIAGAQEKSAFLLKDDQWCRPLGSTPTTHLFKLPIGQIEHQQMDLSDSCENEWLCTKIAEAFGLPVASSEIRTFDDVKVLIVKRFDRKMAKEGSWLMRLPQEDICQALAYSPNLKYQSDGGPGIIQVMNLLLASRNSDVDRDTFFRSQILFWLLAAIDGHAKNFSIFIEPGGHFSLTPLYDMMSAYPLIAKGQLQKQKIKMAMGLIGKNIHYRWRTIQRCHFVSTAIAANYSAERAEKLLDEMLNQVDVVIEKVSEQLPDSFPRDMSQTIFDGMKAKRVSLKI